MAVRALRPLIFLSAVGRTVLQSGSGAHCPVLVPSSRATRTAAVGGPGEGGRVLFIQLAETSTAVAATRSRLAKRALIAAAIRSVAADVDVDAAGDRPQPA